VKALVKTKLESGIWFEDQPELGPDPKDVKITHRYLIGKFTESLTEMTSDKSGRAVPDWEEIA
jgi:hypothetical protein